MRVATVSVAMVATIAIAAVVHAGEGFSMKCQDKSCEYESRVTFGGGMFFNQITGYCIPCQKFVYLSWTRENIPVEMKDRIKATPRPVPLGKVWDGRTGKVLTIHACPTCKGPFLEIRAIADLKHCPACSKPAFTIDMTTPRMAID